MENIETSLAEEYPQIALATKGPVGYEQNKHNDNLWCQAKPKKLVKKR